MQETSGTEAVVMPRLQDIDELIAFLPKLYGENVKYNQALKRLVSDFYRAASQECWSDKTYNPAETEMLLQDADYIKGAGIKEIRTLLTFCQRQERFIEGLHEAMIRRGVIRSILERLRELRAGDVQGAS